MTQLVLRSLRSWLDQKIGQLSFPCLHKEDSNTFLETLAYTTLYKELCTIPSIRGAKIHHNGSNAPVTSLSLFTEQNDFESNQRWISESIFVHTKSDGGLCKAPNGFDGIHSTPMTHASVVPQITHFSPSKRRRVLFVEKDKQCWVELYEQECCISRVCAKELHDMPPHDEIFQRIIWDPCHENEIIYVAEPRHTALYPWEHCIRASENTPVPDSIPRRSKHEVTDSNWGEGLANLTETRLFSCNFSTQNIRPLPMKALGSEANERFSVGSPIALPFDEKEGTASLSRFLFLCIPHSDRKMGLLHCPTRPKFLCLWDHGNVFPIAREHLARVHCLAPSPCGVYLALFNVLDSKAHNAAHEVYILNLKDLVSFFACTDRKPETEECATFLESSRFTSYNNDQAEDRKDPQDFPGLYPSGQRSDLLWLDSDHVLVNSVRRSSNVLYSVNRNTGKWRLHTTEWGTWEVLDTKGVAVVVCFSSMNHCPTVLYTSNILRASQIDGASLPTVIGDNNSGWLHVYDSLRTQSIFRDVFREDTLTSEIHRFHGHHGTEVIVTQPKDLDDLRGTVIVVHGGPHGCDTNRFSYLHASLLLSRFRIFSVNYGGSVGFGQHRIEELGGKVGTHDVEDVIQSFMKSKFYSEGAKNVMMMGGSHGGFLSAHVSGQFPDLLCAVSMRNPVINMSSMYYETDIPDWCIFESGSKNVQDMYNVSPIAWAHNVRTPTLIALGSDDYRVPAHQGRSWWHALRSRNVTVRLIEYPKLGHALDSPSSEADYAIQTLIFFNEALEKQV